VRCNSGKPQFRELGNDTEFCNLQSRPCTSVSPIDLINPGLLVTGHPSGTARDVEETMHFAVPTGIRAVVEERPLAQAPRGTKPRTVRRLLLFTSTRARRQ
jgi:D-arabinose 1-dehydrogenase-like Zn-dependent alcohol dehydrogenase